MVNWVSNWKRVSHSSYDAKILACAEPDDRGFYSKERVRYITRNEKVRQVSNVDSPVLYDKISTLHKVRE